MTYNGTEKPNLCWYAVKHLLSTHSLTKTFIKLYTLYTLLCSLMLYKAVSADEKGHQTLDSLQHQQKLWMNNHWIMPAAREMIISKLNILNLPLPTNFVHWLEASSMHPNVLPVLLCLLGQPFILSHSCHTIHGAYSHLLSRSLSCGTLSKALAKSKYTTSMHSLLLFGNRVFVHGWTSCCRHFVEFTQLTFSNATWKHFSLHRLFSF